MQTMILEEKMQNKEKTSATETLKNLRDTIVVLIFKSPYNNILNNSFFLVIYYTENNEKHSCKKRQLICQIKREKNWASNSR